MHIKGYLSGKCPQTAIRPGDERRSVTRGKGISLKHTSQAMDRARRGSPASNNCLNGLHTEKQRHKL